MPNISEAPSDLLTLAKQLQGLAGAGLAFAQNPYEIDRYNEINHVSQTLMAHVMAVPVEQVQHALSNETGYPTPKVDVRGVVVQDGKILLMKEREDNMWSLPGGWADLGLSPAEVAVKEMHEETGYTAKATRLLGIMDRAKHPHPHSVFTVYKIFIQCEITGGEAMGEGIGNEVLDVGFFGPDDLPPLSTKRVTACQVETLFKHAQDPTLPGFWD